MDARAQGVLLEWWVVERMCIWYVYHRLRSAVAATLLLRRLAPSVRRGAHCLQPGRAVIALLLPLAAPKMRVHGPRPQAVRVALLGPNP